MRDPMAVGPVRRLPTDQTLLHSHVINSWCSF